MNLVPVLFEAKEMIGNEKWLEKYDDYTGLYCFVFSNLTWNFENYYGVDQLVTY